MPASAKPRPRRTRERYRTKAGHQMPVKVWWRDHRGPNKANQPPPGPYTCDAVARRLTQALREAGRGPAHIPQVYALLLVGWIRTYEARVTEVLDEIARWTPEEGVRARLRWARKLRSVFDPRRLERPLALPDIEAPPPAPLPPPARDYRQRPGELAPERDPPPLPEDLEDFLAELGDDPL